MSNYKAYVKTNYFKVKDEKKFKKIINSIECQEVKVKYFEKEINFEKYYAFRANSEILGICNCFNNNSEYIHKCTYSYKNMIKLLQGVVSEDDAIILLEIGNEDTEIIDAYSTVITSNSVKNINLWELSIDKSKEMLKNERYTTEYIG